MHALAAIFRTILSGLQAVIGIVATKEPARDAFLARIYYHLNRTIQRFDRLVTHWRNNTLPKPGKPRPGRPASPASPQTTPRLPQGKAWLIRSVDHYNARCHAGHLEHFLATPEAIAFLAEVPRAGRILRPLAKSLGIQMPGDPPPPAPKPPTPSSAPKPPTDPWYLLPAHERIGIRVLTVADPLHPDFSKPR